MDGAAPRMMTNRMALVVAPNRMIANGNQAIDGIVCSAVISEPVAARSGLIRDTSAPITTPMIRASANPDHGAAQGGADGLPEQQVVRLLPQVGEDRGGPGQDVASSSR